MELTDRHKYTLIAFFLSLSATMLYLKTMVIEPCPSSGKPPKKLMDILLSSLPVSIMVAGAVYLVMNDSPSAPPTNNTSSAPTNAATLPPNRPKLPNMAVNNRAYGGNVRPPQ